MPRYIQKYHNGKVYCVELIIDNFYHIKMNYLTNKTQIAILNIVFLTNIKTLNSIIDIPVKDIHKLKVMSDFLLQVL